MLKPISPIQKPHCYLLPQTQIFSLKVNPSRTYTLDLLSQIGDQNAKSGYFHSVACVLSLLADVLCDSVEFQPIKTCPCKFPTNPFVNFKAFFWVFLKIDGFALFCFGLFVCVRGKKANGLCSSGNGTDVDEGMKLYPLIDGEKVKNMMVMNETRRKLGSFQICAPCTCCGAKGVCLPSPCCYAINCNIPNRPFGFCSFTPRTCNCFGCHL